MLQIISEKWIYALKLLLVVPLFVHAYAIIALNEVFALDLVGFGLTLLGTFTVVKSKFDLSRHHTWTGFCSEIPSPPNFLLTAYIHTYDVRLMRAFTFLFPF